MYQARPAGRPTPTNLAPLAELSAHAQSLGPEPHLARAKRGMSALAAALLWLTLAWRGSGRAEHLDGLDEPLLAALLGLAGLPCAHAAAQPGVFRGPARAAVNAAYLAEWPRRAGRAWVALDAHQVPNWGRGKLGRFQKGWSGCHGRRPCGCRLYLAADANTGQVVTYLVARGRARDAKLLALLGRRLAGVVADCGFASRASVAAPVATGVPFVMGFAHSKPIRARVDALSPQQRRALRALAARLLTENRGPWVYVASLRSWGPTALARAYRRRWRVE